VTAFDARNRAQRAVDAVLAAYLLKPVEPSALYNALAGIAAGNGVAIETALTRAAADGGAQLKELGFAADAVTNGTEAIAALQMPEVDGLSGTHTTIIALTANALERDRRACIDAGMDDYLAKPLEIVALRTVLERWLPLAVAAS
jgi:CheY-like chemotaxis protein